MSDLAKPTEDKDTCYAWCDSSLLEQNQNDIIFVQEELWQREDMLEKTK